MLFTVKLDLPISFIVELTDGTIVNCFKLKIPHSYHSENVRIQAAVEFSYVDFTRSQNVHGYNMHHTEPL